MPAVCMSCARATETTILVERDKRSFAHWGSFAAAQGLKSLSFRIPLCSSCNVGDLNVTRVDFVAPSLTLTVHRDFRRALSRTV